MMEVIDGSTSAGLEDDSGGGGDNTSGGNSMRNDNIIDL